MPSFATWGLPICARVHELVITSSVAFSTTKSILFPCPQASDRLRYGHVVDVVKLLERADNVREFISHRTEKLLHNLGLLELCTKRADLSHQSSQTHGIVIHRFSFLHLQLVKLALQHLCSSLRDAIFSNPHLFECVPRLSCCLELRQCHQHGIWHRLGYGGHGTFVALLVDIVVRDGLPHS